MKKTLAIIFFCLPFCAFSQDTLSKWSWGLTGGVEQSGRQLKESNNNQDVIDFWNGLEENVWRLSGGLRVQRELTQRFSVYSGLTYINRGYRIDTIQDAGLNALEYHFRYLEVPVGVFYSANNGKKNSLMASASFNTAFGLSNTLYYYKNGQTARFEMEAVPNVNSVIFNVSAALGVRRTITNTAKLDLYLSGNQSLSPLANGDLERRFFSVGLFISVMNTF
jgi:hypothetical protein